jgi:hypothetical protein
MHTLAAVLFLALTALAAPAAAQENAVIRGVVLDRADGTPLADVSVRLQDEAPEAVTDAAGRFELTNVAPGRHTVYVTVVGFILVRRTVDVAAGQTLELTIPLSEGTGTYTESVTVTAGSRFREQEPAVPSQQTLGSGDIQNLRNLITNDPMRAIQVLPGVTTGDDFKSEFAVRGSGPGHLNFTFEGIPTSFLLHTIQQETEGGSIAMVNGDILDGISLLNGSYPQRYGNRLGAEVSFLMREGSRDRTQVRVGVSGTDASVVLEGPLAGKSGSWLVSARKSYLELLLRQIDATSDVGFGFSDVQSKMVYDVSPRQRLELSAVAGRSLLDQVSPEGANDLKEGANAAQIVTLGWRVTPSPSTVVTQRVAVAANQFSNTNIDGFRLDHGGGRDLTWRADLAAGVRPALALEGGAQLQWQQRDLRSNRFVDAAGQTSLQQDYDDSGLLSSAYAQLRWSPAARVTLTPGARVDRWSLTRDAGVSPWLQGEVRLSGSFKLRAGGGVYRQFPGFDQSVGFLAAPNARAERAYHTDVGVEQTFGEAARWQVTLYNREERDVLRLIGDELLVINGRLGFASNVARWTNSLDGYARGVELLLQRRSANGLSGWASYSLGFNRYHDRATGEAFDGDFDQRHTLNIHGAYRLTNRTSLAVKFRYGSNTPAPGYWEERGGAFFVSSSRNEVRIPAYSRLDIRGSRTFNWQTKRMTLFVELLNALGHDNMRFNIPSVNGRTRQAFGIFEEMIPRIPSAGILLEF